MQNFVSVPFTAQKHSGLSEVNGMAKFSRAGIVFEFESKLLGLISEGVKEARIPTAEILDVIFKKAILRRKAWIEIRTRSLAAMADVPNSDGKVSLRIKPVDFELAQNAVAKLQADLADFELDQTKQASELPPTHTPVSVLFDASEDETQELKNE